MTDLHTHILYNVDDGSTSFEMSLKMLELAKQAGTENIVLTPHCIPDMYPNYMNDFVVQDVMVGRFEKLRKACIDRKIGVNIYLGMEVYADNNIVNLIRQGAVITINQSRYMLIEFPFETDPMWVGYILSKVQSTGIVPVLAHPERYTYVQQYPYMVHDWVNSGCLIQINRGSIVGRFGEAPKAVAHLLMHDDVVCAVASDAHKPDKRTPFLNDAYSVVEKYFGQRYAQKIFSENPKLIINDRTVNI
ncbi:MAG: CpsB/CapC family capsule biosynthesis tyrosine phosphatase [Acutalibacteraceae bacterium]|nr:CpsB/CapC family capsule biosynthesis tyrosine phosphatase [Acutalibacteraceae bacterium]